MAIEDAQVLEDRREHLLPNYRLERSSPTLAAQPDRWTGAFEPRPQISPGAEEDEHAPARVHLRRRVGSQPRSDSCACRDPGGVECRQPAGPRIPGARG